MRQKTAVITGASSGIGMEFARVFAAMGYHLIITARRTERLNALAGELSVPARILPADLSEKEECFRILQEIGDTPVDIFINNAGFGTCGSFSETDLEKELSMIDVNISAMHILFKAMLRKMKLQKHGRILNVASSAGLLPAGPHMAAYYATKSYVVSLTKAAAVELKEEHSPVQVFALCPGPVDTEFNSRADVVFALPGISPEFCVKEALRGMKQQRTVIVPSLLMRLCTSAQKFLAEPLLLAIVSRQQKRKSMPHEQKHCK